MAIRKLKINKETADNLILFNNLKNAEKASPSLKIEEIEIDRIMQNPNQPRKNFGKEKLDELMKSIEENGILQPIVVRRKEGRFEIVFGERRYRAALQLGYARIPAIIREDVDDKNSLLIALVENLQRDELNPLETANAYNSIINEFQITQEELSKMIGKSRVAVSNTLRLIKLADPVKNFVNQGKISEGHARALVSVKTPELQAEICKKIMEQDLSVRETEKIIHKLVSNVSRETAHRTIKDEHICEVEA
ncbi:MAG TPA: ParB/RepB/Spo0J family partition protein, partial [Candidatus Wallbacteria bacterium]|nr:ParB/RepB/Spo0J family partition protein [Candidatus Wallbacteria bacterium]